MKKSTIVLIAVIAVLVGTFIATFSNTTNSVGFDDAFASPGTEFKVSGTLEREYPVVYDPEQDHNLTVFHMRDIDNNIHEVKLKKPKPQGLEQSETVDLYGKVIDGEFIATDMLMKCPSKYNEQNHLIETAQAN